MARPTSLTARLVLTVVALVTAVVLAVALVTTLAVRDSLNRQLDTEVRDALQRAAGPVAGPGEGPRPPGDGTSGTDGADGPAGPGNQQPRTVIAQLPDDGEGTGTVLTDRRDEDRELDDDVLAQLADVPTDGQVHRVDLDDLGSYRVLAVDGTTLRTGEEGTLAVGLPTDDADAAVGSLLLWEAVLAALAVLAAAVAGTVLVRRQLRPLTQVAATAHDVAAQPLAAGEVGRLARVPQHLTDERTEVGTVGAALDTLLAHVEQSLDARHRSEQQVRQFVADASHELRTPLATIAGYTELARARPADQEAARTALAKVAVESRRMTALVEDLLLLARLDAGRPLAQAPVDLTRLLVEAVSDARVVAPDHQWRIVVPPDVAEDPVPVQGDEQRLHQVVTNLLTNARTHTPPGTTVTVTARRDGFEVRDDGPGMPPDLLPRVFERFARADASRHREDGVGLGMALVKAIVVAHGGEVGVTSVPGDTRVSVRIGYADD